MGELIYWKQYEVPIKYSHNIGGKVHIGEKTGEYVCTDERIESFSFIGYLNPLHSEDQVKIKAMFIFKDGSRHEKNIELSDEESHIDQAECFLNSIK